MNRTALLFLLLLLLTATACTTGRTTAATPDATPLSTRNIDAVKGQKVTCAGPTEKTFDLELIEKTVDLGLGTTFAAWTYNGRIPAPVIEACEGDKVVI